MATYTRRYGASTGTAAQWAALVRRTGAIAETIPRMGGFLAAAAALTSGKMTLIGIPLLKGTVVSKITFAGASTGAGTPTNQWFGLWSSAGEQLGLTSDDTTTAWAVNSEKQLTLSSPYTVTADGLFYISCMVAATTVPTLVCASVNVVGGLAPIMAATDNTHTGLTNPASAPSTAILTASANQPYAWVS
jgi:hypothetical protein